MKMGEMCGVGVNMVIINEVYIRTLLPYLLNISRIACTNTSVRSCSMALLHSAYALQKSVCCSKKMRLYCKSSIQTVSL